MSYVNPKLEGFAQKIRPEVCARIVSGVFYLLAAFVVVLTTKALLSGEGLEPFGAAVRLFFGFFLAGTVMHSAILFIFAAPLSVRQFIGIVAAWVAPLLVLLSWRII